MSVETGAFTEGQYADWLLVRSQSTRRDLEKLVGLTRKEVVVELENGLRVHFPRIGTIVEAV